MQWVVQLNNYKHNIQNSKKSILYSFRPIKTRDSQAIKERGLLYYFLFISRCSPNYEFMFLENESELCECRANFFFGGKGYGNISGPTHRLPFRVSWARLSVHKIYFYHHIFERIFFSSVIDALINLVRSISWEWKKKKEFRNRSRKFEGVASQKLEETWLSMWLHYRSIFT